MENQIAEDIGEEIISRLKELIEILKLKAREQQNGKECTNSSLSRNRTF